MLLNLYINHHIGVKIYLRPHDGENGSGIWFGLLIFEAVERNVLRLNLFQRIEFKMFLTGKPANLPKTVEYRKHCDKLNYPNSYCKII